MTVANFMTYVCSGAYTNTIIHRSSEPPRTPDTCRSIMIQGGGYALDGLIPTLIPFNAPVANEFSISNTRGTLAMAQSQRRHQQRHQSVVFQHDR